MTAYKLEYNIFEYNKIEPQIHEYDVIINDEIENKLKKICITIKFKNMPICKNIA